MDTYLEAEKQRLKGVVLNKEETTGDHKKGL